MNTILIAGDKATCWSVIQSPIHSSCQCSNTWTVSETADAGCVPCTRIGNHSHELCNPSVLQAACFLRNLLWQGLHVKFALFKCLHVDGFQSCSVHSTYDNTSHKKIQCPLRSCYAPTKKGPGRTGWHCSPAQAQFNHTGVASPSSWMVVVC